MRANKFRFLLFSSILTIATTTVAQTTVAEQTEEVDGTQVLILVPNVSCYGRFHDSLKEHLQRKHDWIHSVSIRNTEKVSNPYKVDAGTPKIISLDDSGDLPFDIGTIAELTFTIDASKSTLDLLKAIRDSKQYSLKRWTVQIAVPIEEMLPR